MRFVFGLLAVILGVAALVEVPPSAPAQASGPALETPEATLAAHLHCPGALTNLSRDPVLLVTGTGLNGGENYDWNYALALPAAGFAYCTVDLQDAGMADIQVSSEYVVFAIRKMAQESGRKVAVVAYSQGGLEPRWALRYWPELRQSVSDFIGLAPAQHGADTAAFLCGLPSGCGPSIKQMSPGSRFLQTINNGAQVWAPVDYTSIYSLTDGVVIPPALRSSLATAPGVNVANIAVQQVCPQNGVVHIGIPADGAVFALVMDALLRPGPADATRVSAEVCTSQPFVPGVTAAVAAAKAEELNALAGTRILGYPSVAQEPAIKAYAAADAPPVAPVAPAPPATGSGWDAGQGSPADYTWLAVLVAAWTAFGVPLMIYRRVR